jgi:glycosyltransferase involved in cell wall biosynthesis
MAGINNNYFVCIRCMTYNHASYITDAMNGFCMQQTTFPFVAIIVDDASTDGEPEVIKNFLYEHFDMANANTWETEDAYFIEAVHLINRNCNFAVVLLKRNLYRNLEKKYSLIARWGESAKFVTLCEGDDYWTNPNKLQMQVDFIESHPDYSMCFHDVDIKAEKGREWYDVFGKLEDRDYTGLENMVKWSVPTCSMVMRREVYETRPANPKFTMGDNVLILHCSRSGKIRCIPKKMGVYRLTPTSWIGGQSSKVQRYKYISHYLGLIEEFEECRCEQMYDILENQYFQLLTILKREGDKAEFERVKQEYLNYPGTTHWNRFRPYYFKSTFRDFMKSLLGKNIVAIIRKVKK